MIAPTLALALPVSLYHNGRIPREIRRWIGRLTHPAYDPSLPTVTADALFDQQLHALLRAIASRNRSLAGRLLASSPGLARLAVTIGASRAGTETHFLEDISHYVYAGDTALHIAAAGYQHEVAEQLVSSGANVGARNRRGAEPLHYACDGIPGSAAWDPEAQSSIVAFLVRTGADPDATDKSGVAPLHRAVRTRCSAAVRALLANGADVVRRNRRGATPLHLAVVNTGRGGSGSAASRAEQSTIIQLLLMHGARPSERDANGRTVNDCVTMHWIRALLDESPA